MRCRDRSRTTRTQTLAPAQSTQIGNLKPLFTKLYPECWKTHQTCSSNLSDSLTYTQGAQRNERAKSARTSPARLLANASLPSCRCGTWCTTTCALANNQ